MVEIRANRNQEYCLPTTTDFTNTTETRSPPCANDFFFLFFFPLFTPSKTFSAFLSGPYVSRVYYVRWVSQPEAGPDKTPGLPTVPWGFGGGDTLPEIGWFGRWSRNRRLKRNATMQRRSREKKPSNYYCYECETIKRKIVSILLDFFDFFFSSFKPR